MNIINLVKNLFKIAKLISVDDSGDLRFYTVSALGKTQKVLGFTPYGLMSNPPTTSMALLWNQQGQGSNGIAMADDPPNRLFKNLSEGEVALANYAAANYIKFNNGGVTDINGNDDNFVRWIPFNLAMQIFLTAYNAHTHNTAPFPPDIQLTMDLGPAKTDTVATTGYTAP